jgi:hypothetical protein
MASKQLADLATAAALKQHGFKEALVIDQTQAKDPTKNQIIHRFKVTDATHANQESRFIFLEDDGKLLEATTEQQQLFEVSAFKPVPVAAALTAGVTIQPATNTLTLKPADTLDETLTVLVPKNAGPVQADVYFLADTTGSMGSILAAVQTGASSILTSLGGLGADLMFGVGNYKDFEKGVAVPAFSHQLSPSNVSADITTAINAWTATGGGDTPEAALFALNALAIPAGGTIGWRSGSKRIIVWFGDAPSHDPICTAISGATADITEASVTAALVTQNITVLALSTATPGLDNDPTAGASGYVAACGPAGGLPGQATRITTATAGLLVTGTDPSTIVSTIISLVKGAISSITNIKLVPSASIAPFVIALTPAGGYGPLPSDAEHVLKFEIKFHGIPCKPEPQVITGTIDVVVDGSVVTAKKVQITVPACAPTGHVYAVKFVCGIQEACDCDCEPVVPGTYSTEINIHNHQTKPVTINRRFIPLVFSGAPAGREPHAVGARVEDKIVLEGNTATMVDCCRINELLLGAPTQAQALTVGFLELTASAEIAITAVYSASNPKSAGVSLEVVQITGHRRS